MAQSGPGLAAAILLRDVTGAEPSAATCADRARSI
jgi:hypothetical protein